MPDVAGGSRRLLARALAVTHRLSSLRLPPLRLPGVDPTRAVHALRGRPIARDRVAPLAVAGLVLVASLLSVTPASGIRPTGDTEPDAIAPRIVAGGGVLGPAPAADRSSGSLAPGLAAEKADAASETSATDGRFLPDGTLLKPVAVETDVPDAKGRLVDYYVKSGDTLTGIADQFGISMMTLWWANHLASKDALHVDQHLVVPPVDGLVVTVRAGDTLDSIASGAGVDPQGVADYNGLTDGTVVIGQTLILPGAVGPGIATPKPASTPRPATTTKRTTTTVAKTPTIRYTGGRLYFPLPGHGINQYYHYGHYAIDIAGQIGDAVHAAAAGTVLYAGWKNNGGGLVVWISHGSGLYTTYNHMSAVLVHTGQVVSRGQVVGRIGMTGWATGPHLHFEVWVNGVPGGVDRRVNPMRYF